MYLGWAQDIPLATAQTSLSESPPLLSQSILYSKLDCETPPPCLALSQMKKQMPQVAKIFYQGHIANSLQSWVCVHVCLLVPLPCNPIYSTFLYTQQAFFKNPNPGERSRNSTYTEKFLCVSKNTQRSSPTGDPGQVQSDLLLHNVDQTLLQETACLYASSPIPIPNLN